MSFGGFHRHRRRIARPANLTTGARPARNRRVEIPPSPRSRLEIVDGGARFTIERELHSPNRTLWKDAGMKVRDRNSWGAAIYNAIVVFFEANGTRLSVYDTQGIANRPRPVLVDGKTVMRRPSRAPAQHYTVLIVREVPKKANFIRDDDNLLFATKGLRDALKAHSVIFEDSRAWLTCPLPIQRVAEDGCYRTIVDVTPWAPPTLSGRSHAADQ